MIEISDCIEKFIVRKMFKLEEIDWRVFRLNPQIIFKGSTFFQTGADNSLNHMLCIAFLFERIGFIQPIDDLSGLRPAAGGYFLYKDIDKNIEVARCILRLVGMRVGRSQKGR